MGDRDGCKQLCGLSKADTARVLFMKLWLQLGSWLLGAIRGLLPCLQG